MRDLRLPSGGRIDRSRSLEFRFNGASYRGFEDDTLASALLAGGVRVIGRSFKYHRPRGVFSAGPEEPSALVQLGDDPARTDPNCAVTDVELYAGLVAQSQNCWPSVNRDVGAINELFSSLMPAGFYYKTFKWPAGLWATYEKVIRQAAGLGRSPSQPDPDRYDHAIAFCDVLVVGGGPSGLSAALAAARTGARVILADERPRLGGSLLATAPGTIEIDGRDADTWVDHARGELESFDEVRLLNRTTVTGYYGSNYLTLLERVTDHLGSGKAAAGVPRQRLWKVRAGQVVLATGAIERPLVFADNDRPGIMLAGAVRAYLNQYAVAAGRRILVVTNNDSAYRTALDLVGAGISVPAIVDLRPSPHGELAARARQAGLDILGGYALASVEGRNGVRRCKVMRLSTDGGSLDAGVETWIDCDAVAVSGGWNPTVHLFSQSRGTLRYEPEPATFVPGRSAQAERSAGACNGARSLAETMAQGATAGVDAARAAGFDTATPPAASVAVDGGEEPPEAPPRHLWLLPSDRKPGTVKAFVDLHNDVTAKDLKLALREGYRSVEHVKRYTTTGMGLDQGKTGNVTALGILADAKGLAIPEVGVTTFRPPYTPLTIGAVAGRNSGRFLAPVRKTPMHAWHEAHGAAFENVGQWKRAWYYPHAGESMHDAVGREVAAARASVAVLDASTLGKIDVRGPDAVTFLNRVYTNAWTKLGGGRCRYGLMLGEDGMVMDDGVTTRLADDHFHMTTTTGGAAAVMSWLENWLQTEWPDLKVYLTSVTEQWAVISMCGPNSRQLLGELTDDIDLDHESFPPLSMREGHVAGVPARVFRISFTGELSYEINVPAARGMAVWEAVWNAGEKHAITAYGTEAMHVLRAEKGFIIVGQETDGTTTPIDLGMDWIVSKTKDFVGKRSLSRTDTVRDDRKHLVGLYTDDPSDVLEEGAHLVEAESVPVPPTPDPGACHVQLLQPERRPLDRIGPGQGRAPADRQEAVRGHAGPDDPGDGGQAHLL